jgi:hypothetical protein
MDRCEPPFERGNGIYKVVAALREHPGKDRVFWLGTIVYLGSFFLGGKVTV